MFGMSPPVKKTILLKVVGKLLTQHILGPDQIQAVVSQQ